MQGTIDFSDVIERINRLPVSEEAKTIFVKMFDIYSGKRIYVARYLTDIKSREKVIKQIAGMDVPLREKRVIIEKRFNVSRNTAINWLESANR